MKTDKILQSLKIKHEQLLKQVSSLTTKKERIEKYLQEAMTESAQTEEAILALEGKSSQIKQMLEQAVQTTGWKGVPPIIVPASAEAVPEKSSASALPPPEAGMKWAKNEVDEDVLVPINIPTPKKVAGITDANNFILPVIDDEEGFESPKSFL